MTEPRYGGTKADVCVSLPGCKSILDGLRLNPNGVPGRAVVDPSRRQPTDE